ncbi:MAG: TadE/TadG family type IV pilus assembly protein [Bosea sp. (in: a-proteobacteria)]
MFSSALRRFKNDDEGAVAIIFAMALLPVLSFTGASVDYTSATKHRAALQAAADTAALAGTKTAATDVGRGIEEAKRVFEANLPTGIAGSSASINFDPSKKTINIVGKFNVNTNFLSIVNINTIPIEVKSSATMLEQVVVTTKDPVASFLDSEAGDYNRIYVYCFDHNRKNDPDKGRTQMTPLLDNAGTNYKTKIPECKEHETISFRLYNVRNARTNSWMWDNAPVRKLEKHGYNDLSDVRYEYFTDTTVAGNKMKYNIEGNVPILETKICDTATQCRSTAAGGIIPSGKDRTPTLDEGSCPAGKYVYFGWEDRPKDYGWTDGDYDDITYVIECPQKTISKRNVGVRLVQ